MAPATPAPGNRPEGRGRVPAENGDFRVRERAPQGPGDTIPASVRERNRPVFGRSERPTVHPFDDAQHPSKPLPVREEHG